MPAESQQGAVRLDDSAPDRRLVQNEKNIKNIIEKNKNRTLYLESVQGSEASDYLQLAAIPTGSKT